MLQHLRAGAGGLVLAALTFFLNPADAAPADESPWQLRHVEPETDTRIYLRSRGAAVPAFRGVTRLQARLSTLVALLLDTEQMPEWVFRVRRVRPIEAPDPMHGVTQVITGMPWPLQDREAIDVYRNREKPNEYENYVNCNKDSFDTAASTLKERITKYGADSAALQSWVAAQDVVFSNCSSGTAIPEPLPATDDALMRTDRAYQIAAANSGAGGSGGACGEIVLPGT